MGGYTGGRPTHVYILTHTYNFLKKRVASMQCIPNPFSGIPQATPGDCVECNWNDVCFLYRAPWVEATGEHEDMVCGLVYGDEG